MSIIEQETPVQTQIKQFTGSKESEILRYVNEQFERCRRDRMQFERNWYLNIAFYFGRQFVTWTGGGTSSDFAKLHEPPAPPWRVRLISNKIRPITRTELAKVTKERPTAFVIPATSDDDDIAAARAGEAIFEHLWRDLVLHRQIRRSAFWMLLCGSSFMKDWYDPNKPDNSGVLGSISIEPVTPFHFLVPDIQEEDIENQEYVIHTLAKSAEWVNQVFKKEVSPDSNVQANMLEQRFLSAMGVQAQTKSHVSVKEMWCKPSRRFPQGAKVTWTSEQLLAVEEGQIYNHGQFPFTKFDHIPTGRFYADSTINDLIPLQREYNRTRSQIIESKNRMSKPQLMAPRGSIDPNKVTSEPGLIITYQPGYAPPTPLPLQNLPPYVLEEIDRIQRDMDDISSQHEVTKGRTPPGVTAATAISYLQEEDDSKLAATISSIEEGVERLGRHFLSHVQQFWDAERQIRVIGDDGQFESFMFTKANIRGNMDLRVEAGSATPRSRAAKQAFITELGKMGWITPEQAMRYLDMAETGRLYEEMQIDSRQAQRENIKMKAGIQVPVNTFDNHARHKIEHENFMKSQAFEEADDQIKIIFETHRMMHDQLIAQQMGQMIEPGEQLVDPAMQEVQQEEETEEEPSMEGEM